MMNWRIDHFEDRLNEHCPGAEASPAFLPFVREIARAHLESRGPAKPVSPEAENGRE